MSSMTPTGPSLDLHLAILSRAVRDGKAAVLLFAVLALGSGILTNRPASAAATAPAAEKGSAGKRAAPPAAGKADARRSAFTPVGDLPGGRTQSEALGVSEDGRVVFGESASERSGGGAEAFRWTEKDGLRPLGGAFPVAECILFQSRIGGRGGGGARYEAVGRFPLAAESEEPA